MLVRHVAISALLLCLLSACGMFEYGAATNTRSRLAAPEKAIQTGFAVRTQRDTTGCEEGGYADPKKNKDVLVLLALSGGGSRAAYFSAQTMFEMQGIELKIGDAKSDLLHEVDVISSVSGGSLPAAYYAVSHDPGTSCSVHTNKSWTRDEVLKLMSLDFRSRWFGRWFWPTNIAAYWFTKLDRTDIMAQTLADKLFDQPITGFDLTFSRLNPLRPNLILNATTGIDDESSGIRFGEVFTFTNEDFTRICSSIENYSIARGVMATAAFPGVFNFMTLRNYCSNNAPGKPKGARYLHLFDGGNADNLGLTSLKRVIWSSLRSRDTQPVLPYKHVIIISVDAFINFHSIDPESSDPRGAFDFIMDRNFVDATDCLLESNRRQLLAEFEEGRANLFPFGLGSDSRSNKKCREFFHDTGDREKYCGKSPVYWKELNAAINEKLTFIHLSFDSVGDVKGCMNEFKDPDCLRQQLNHIRTDFRIGGWMRHKGTGLTDVEAIDCAVPTLFGKEGRMCGNLTPKASVDINEKWQRVKEILEAR